MPSFWKSIYTTLFLTLYRSLAEVYIKDLEALKSSHCAQKAAEKLWTLLHFCRELSARPADIFPFLAAAEKVRSVRRSATTRRWKCQQLGNNKKAQLQWTPWCTFHTNPVVCTRLCALNLLKCKWWAVSSRGTAHSVHTFQYLRDSAHFTPSGNAYSNCHAVTSLRQCMLIS